LPAPPADDHDAATSDGCQLSVSKIYPGAHDFFADYRQSFRADAAHDAWLSTQAWFKKYKVLD
jgi:carboxymethylenebutenolidase